MAAAHLHLPRLRRSVRSSAHMKNWAGKFAFMNRARGPRAMSAAINIPSKTPWGVVELGVVGDKSPLSKYIHRAAMARPRPCLRLKRASKFHAAWLPAIGALHRSQRQL